MRILVLGAGALGGYFGGRLLEAGADVAFLVRPRRRAQLERDGLVVESPYGAFRRRPVPLLSSEDAAPGWDVVLLACKAYDLEDGIAAIRPAVDARTAVLPVLNGVSHIETLRREFGAERVLGGIAKIQATLAPDGSVRHLNDWRYLTFGEMDGRMSLRVQAIAEAASGARGVVAAAVPDIAFRLWEKLVHLGTSAVSTVLMRANVGEIVRAAPGGAALLLRVLERNAAIAAAHGHPMRDSFLEEYRAVFSDRESAYSASILRDLEAGGRIEADHILGFLLEAARRAGVPAELHEAAFLHAKAYEQRRDAGRLPRL
jgi:2-dehydropantoate 2-reductase